MLYHSPLAPIEYSKQLIDQQRYDEAQHELERLDSQGASTAESLYLLGIVHYTRNQIPQAVDYFKRALFMNPDYVDAAISLSIVYNDTGHYQEATQLFTQAEKSLARKPSSSTASMILDKEIARRHIELGDMYRKINRFDEAANEYLKATRIDPDNIDAQMYLAKTMANRGQLEQAYQEFQKLIQKYPHYVPIRIQLALTCFASGNFVDAQMELDQALRQDPNNAEAKMYQSMARDATESTLL
jgi:tetratricopeptide (TPR) repeat protein